MAIKILENLLLSHLKVGKNDKAVNLQGGGVLGEESVNLKFHLPYFLEISPYLEIPPPSKSRRTYKEVGSNKRRPRNLAAWKRVVGFKVCGMQAHVRDSHYRNGRVLRREAGEWTSRRP